MVFAVISQEKTVKNIESFDKTALKHTETEVKNPLPNKESKSSTELRLWAVGLLVSFVRTVDLSRISGATHVKWIYQGEPTHDVLTNSNDSHVR